MDLSYEYADHERFIDRVPTQNGEPVEAFEKIVLETRFSHNTLEADIFRANLSHEFQTPVKQFLYNSSEFEKCIKTLCLHMMEHCYLRWLP